VPARFPRRSAQPRGQPAGGADADAANIAFNMLKATSGRHITIGPLLLGLASPAHVLTPTASVRRIVNSSALASVAAHWRSHMGTSVLSRINAVAGGDTETSCIAWGGPSAVGHLLSFALVGWTTAPDWLPAFDVSAPNVGSTKIGR
jgi:hypothetical protein